MNDWIERRRSSDSVDSNEERGAAMVEMAIVGMLLAFLCMGMIELGFAWRDSITIEQASRLGVRAGAAMTGDDRADQLSVQALIASLEANEYDQLQYVVVWDATTSSEMPAGCETGSSVALKCNHYTKAMLDNADDAGRWGCVASSYDVAWCPTSRDAVPEDPTYLGLHIQSRRNWMTNFFPGGGIDFGASTIMSLVPADY